MNMEATMNKDIPSAQVVAKALSEVVITDDSGRKIKLKRPGVLAQYRMVEMLGDTAKNEVYTSMVLPLIFVVEIEGVPVFNPASKRELEALIQRLDEHGIMAVNAGVTENFGRSNPDADKAALKN
jgi:hypothetical protein